MALAGRELALHRTDSGVSAFSPSAVSLCRINPQCGFIVQKELRVDCIAHLISSTCSISCSNQ